jgi:hypothetical protein
MRLYEEFGRDVLEPHIIEMYRVPYVIDGWAAPREVHGIAHICRCLVLGEAMMNFYVHLAGRPEETFDRPAVRHAIAFHDVGRQDEGEDLWEADSAAAATRFLVERGVDEAYARYVGRLVDKDYVARHLPRDPNAFIVTAADCLDIIRVFPLNGLFNRNRFGFLHPTADVIVGDGDRKPWMARHREGLLEDNARWIEATEHWQYVRRLESSSHPLRDLLDQLEGRRREYEVLWGLLEVGQ